MCGTKNNKDNSKCIILNIINELRLVIDHIKVLGYSLNPFTPTDLYGMFQIKVWTIPFWVFRVERVKHEMKGSIPNEYKIYICFIIQEKNVSTHQIFS